MYKKFFFRDARFYIYTERVFKHILASATTTLSKNTNLYTCTQREKEIRKSSLTDTTIVRKWKWMRHGYGFEIKSDEKLNIRSSKRFHETSYTILFLILR